jgi:hypothetical protein
MNRIKKNDPVAITERKGIMVNHWWEMWLRIFVWDVCLYYNGDGVEKDTKKESITLNRQQLVVILRLEAFLHFMKRSNADATEQQNISSLLPSVTARGQRPFCSWDS